MVLVLLIYVVVDGHTRITFGQLFYQPLQKFLGIRQLGTKLFQLDKFMQIHRLGVEFVTILTLMLVSHSNCQTVTSYCAVYEVMV